MVKATARHPPYDCGSMAEPLSAAVGGFCTVARWHYGQIVEENLFYDLVGLMQQVGIEG
jgi:hypothetical protein